MLITDLFEVLRLEISIVLNHDPNQPKWVATITRYSIRLTNSSSTPIRVFGNTPNEVLSALVEDIKGKTIVGNSYIEGTNVRQEYKMPDNLTFYKPSGGGGGGMVLV